MDPPPYADTTAPPSFEELLQELPNYGDLVFHNGPRQRRPAGLTTAHVYTIPTKKASPWLTLRVNSKARTSNHLPYFWEGDAIAGSVDLDLEQEMTIKAVTVSLMGDLITPDAASLTFLDVTHELWSSAKGDPRGVDTENEENIAPLPWKEKLVGKLSWPFSLAIPSEVRIKAGRTHNVFKTPCSFMERGANVTILYRLKTTIIRGKFLPSSIVDTTVVIIPRIRPQSPSLAMQLAYQERHPLIGPIGDPEGWHTLDQVNMRGTLFRTREIGVQCVLSLAKPLSYTRGSVIPLFLTLRSTDLQALDVFSAKRAAVVRLRRSVIIDSDVLSAPGPTRANPKSEITYEYANWWLSPFESGNHHRPQTRMLQGEICLPPSLAPTAHLQRYRILYTVDLLPFEAAGFSSAQPADIPLQRVEVEIATTYAPGPHPILYSASFAPM